MYIGVDLNYLETTQERVTGYTTVKRTIFKLSQKGTNYFQDGDKSYDQIYCPKT